MNKVERKEIKRELVFVFIESYRYVVEWYRLLFVESYHVELRFEFREGQFKQAKFGCQAL